MELPDGPPGTEGYEEDVANLSKNKQEGTKAEQEFFEHLKSLKISLDDGSTRSMVQRKGRDVSGKWIYLCFPCAAVCSGENIFQTHLSGKKHKAKLATKTIWPLDVFSTHPYIQRSSSVDKGQTYVETVTHESAEKRLALPEDKEFVEMEQKYGKYRDLACYIQDSLNSLKYPLIGLEYLIEFPPQESHHDPNYLCVLCVKKGHPRTIVNHLTCFWHRYSYISRHYSQAAQLLTPYTRQFNLRAAVSLVMNRLSKCIEDKYGRMKPLLIETDEFEADRDRISRWIFRSPHFNEKQGPTFTEVVDKDLFTSIQNSEPAPEVGIKGPSTVKNFRKRAPSMETISDDSADEMRRPRDKHLDRYGKERKVGAIRYDPYAQKVKEELPMKTKYADRKDKNYDYKMKLANDKLKVLQESANKTFLYHQKNPEKHPLYPEEWKKFWNRRYKELQAEGKDVSSYDFKPEWIKFWTDRMKELYDEEMQVQAIEVYRKFSLRPPEVVRSSRIEVQQSEAKSEERRPPREDERPRERRSGERRHYARLDDRRRDLRSPDRHRDSPGRRRESPGRRTESPGRRREPPGRRRESPGRRRESPGRRRESPGSRREVRPDHHGSRFDGHRRDGSSGSDSRSRSRSLLRSRQFYNRSPSPLRRNPTPPALQTVLVSDEDLKSVGDASPWNSSGSVGSAPDVHQHTALTEQSAPDDVVGVLRLLVALEDNLGSLGPRVVNLLTSALTMEKERANSSEKLLDDDTNLTLLETAKEKLKGAVQAGLVTRGHAAARTAVVRTAALLHHADRRRASRPVLLAPSNIITAKPATPPSKPDVDRSKIAQEIAAVLVAQGKTNISSQELEALVDSVVAKAMKKKEEVAKVSSPVTRLLTPTPASPWASLASKPAPAMTPSASALQLLQSAYDETDKKPAGSDKPDPPDAMDGLSDSDLQMLLRNFNELSAEEQHSLIAYLKKLEAREPLRVERLRDYVSLAGTAKPEARAAPPAAPAPPRADKVVHLESDDDDYTVEEVFKLAKEKVKEKQTMQELEVVKKSLLESVTAAAPPAAPVTTAPAPAASVMSMLTSSLNSASAANVLAMVHASMQAQHDAPPAQPVQLVNTNTQPISFGDNNQQLPSHNNETLPQSQGYDDTQLGGPALVGPPNPNYAEPEPYQQHEQWPPQNYDQTQQNYDQTQQNYDQTQQNYDQTQQNYDQTQQNYNQTQQNYDQTQPYQDNYENQSYNNSGDTNYDYNNKQNTYDHNAYDEYNQNAEYNDMPYNNEGNYNQNYNAQYNANTGPARGNRPYGRGRGNQNQQRGNAHQTWGNNSSRGNPRGKPNQQRGNSNQPRGNSNQPRGNSNQPRGNANQSRGNANQSRGNANQARGTRGRGRRGRFNDNIKQLR